MLLTADLILWAAAFVLGTVLGSFSGALIYRLHTDTPGLWTGRSQCPQCKQTLKWWNLIPLLSYALQSGKCAYCKKKIPFSYFLLELVFGLTFFLFVQKFSSTENVIPLLLAVWTLLVLFFYDLFYLEVDLRLVVPAIILALLWTLFRDQSPAHYWIGALLGGGFYALQFVLSRGAWVGAGDIYFGVLLGLLLGWPQLLLCLFMAYVLGTAVAAYLMLFKGYGRKAAVPMGAFLMPAGLVFLYNGDWWLNQYLVWSGLDQWYGF